MTKRKFSGKRLYRLSKRIVIIASVLSGILAAGSYYSIQSNNLLYEYQEICSEYPKGSANHLDCMIVGFEAISDIQNIFYRAYIIAVILPTIFFGGTWLYRYLFPVQEEKVKKPGNSKA